MNLKGEKVHLRAIEKEDLIFLNKMINDSELEKNVVGWSFPISMAEQTSWYEKQLGNSDNLRFIIEVDNKKIGMATITHIDWKNRSAIHGIKLDNIEIRGKGYGTDTVKTIMKYAFEELQLNRLYGSILDYNIASQKLYEKCGWKIEGIEKKSVFKNNEYHDKILVAILRDEYLEWKTGEKHEN